MTIGASIFLIALGAILVFAVEATVAGFSIQTAGVILMVAGAVGLVIGLFLLSRAAPRRGAHRPRRPRRANGLRRPPALAIERAGPAVIAQFREI